MNREQIIEIVETQVDNFVGSNRRYGVITYMIDEYELEELARRIADSIMELNE